MDPRPPPAYIPQFYGSDLLGARSALCLEAGHSICHFLVWLVGGCRRENPPHVVRPGHPPRETLHPWFTLEPCFQVTLGQVQGPRSSLSVDLPLGRGPPSQKSALMVVACLSTALSALSWRFWGSRKHPSVAYVGGHLTPPLTGRRAGRWTEKVSMV